MEIRYFKQNKNSKISYATVYQPSTTNQALTASKSSLSRRELNVPRVELIAADMAGNLALNIKRPLWKQNIISITGWMHNNAVPHWPSDNKTYKVFVAKRVNIVTLQHTYIKWKYVSTKQSDADISSRGSPLSK